MSEERRRIKVKSILPKDLHPGVSPGELKTMYSDENDYIAKQLEQHTGVIGADFSDGRMRLFIKD